MQQVAAVRRGWDCVHERQVLHPQHSPKLLLQAWHGNAWGDDPRCPSLSAQGGDSIALEQGVLHKDRRGGTQTSTSVWRTEGFMSLTLNNNGTRLKVELPNQLT
jgi:hypothetical protein